MNTMKFPGFPEREKTNFWSYPKIINGYYHLLTASEQSVLWYLLRHTWGWQKKQDEISLTQFRIGIKNKKNEWVDHGTGLTEPTILKALKRLEKKEFIIVDRKKGKINCYRLKEIPLKIFNTPTKDSLGVTTKDSLGVTTKDSLGTINNNIIYTRYIINNIPRRKEIIKPIFSYKLELKKLLESKRRQLHVIGIYWKYKNYNFDNKEKFESAFKRDLRAAKALMGYSDDEILQTMDWLEDNTEMKWTLESVHKFIDEDLDNLKSFKI